MNIEKVVNGLVKEHGAEPVQLLQILNGLQAHFHHVPESAINLVAEQLSISPAHVVSLIEFYSFLSLTPRGDYEILISDSITDQMIGSRAIIDQLCNQLGVELGTLREDGRVSVDTTSCTGMCDQGPAGLINGLTVTRLDSDRIDEIVKLIEGSIPLVKWPDDLFEVDDNIQQRGLLLENVYALGDAIRATFERGRVKTLDELTNSALRGRGGAGFKTAMKWHFCHESYTTGDSEGDLGLVCDSNSNNVAADCDRFVVCNADEGEPGTFKDRLLLTTHAHQLIEGMTVCAAIIGACQGYIYLRGEYRYLLDSLEAVLEERRHQNLLGSSILGEQFHFDIEIRLGAGAYICGEESALIESLEGNRGIPRNRPPFPVTNGYLNKPTVVNNVETFVCAAAIADKGGNWFSQYGTEQSTGTKLLSISGDCARPGIYEFAFGISVYEILDRCGADLELLGVQVGGPSGTFITTDEFERKIAFEDLATGGSFIIFNSTRNLFDIVQNFTHFFRDFRHLLDLTICQTNCQVSCNYNCSHNCKTYSASHIT